MAELSLLGYIASLFDIHVDTLLRGGVPLMGGPFGPSVSRSPAVTPQEKAGRPMGPSTLLCTDP